MIIHTLLAEIDAEMRKWQRLRNSVVAIFELAAKPKQSHHTKPAPKPKPAKKHHISRAGRAAIAKAARKRWAAFHTAQKAKAKK
jgi:hypothetical protein